MTKQWEGTPAAARQPWFARGQRRLDQILQSAPVLSFDDDSRIILLSDAHRGDRGVHDEFAPNEDLFVHALSHYRAAGFTYIELGDGDDLWQTPRFSCINPGYITGIEIQDGLLRFVKWFATGGHEYQYTRLAPARGIRELI